ncbi:MAG: hypothetical protein K8U57_11290 [Planctomycetes bacterium]|nr:hypothetical protein [Planctomycetota bacterium]
MVADNGRGKTAVLDAAATVLSQFVDEFTGCSQSEGIAQGDVRIGRDQQPQLPTRLRVTVEADGRYVGWSCERKL